MRNQTAGVKLKLSPNCSVRTPGGRVFGFSLLLCVEWERNVSGANEHFDREDVLIYENERVYNVPIRYRGTVLTVSKYAA
jgi:hypothetical protein